MKIGATSYAFRYSFLDPGMSPPLTKIIVAAREAGVERLQICENTHPFELSKKDWEETVRCAADVGMELQLGCKTLKCEEAERYLRLAEELACDQLRIATEEADDHLHGTRANVSRLLDAVVPKFEKAGVRLAIENHFDVSSSLLVELTNSYSADVVGFCIDIANSLRSFETPEKVLELLGHRAFCYHLKDYLVVGSMISFSVVGAPLGEGALDLDGCLRTIFQTKPVPPLYVETWTPNENGREQNIQREADWLRRSVQNLRLRLSALEQVAA